MKTRVYGESVGLVPENDQEKRLLEEFFLKGIFVQSFGEHGVGADAETRLSLIKNPTVTMKAKGEIQKMIETLKKRRSSSSNMNYEIGGATEALEWVLSEREFFGAGLR